MKDIWLILVGGLLICAGAGIFFQSPQYPALGLILAIPGVIVGFAGLIENHKRHAPPRRYR